MKGSGLHGMPVFKLNLRYWSGARLSGDGLQFALKSDPKSWLPVNNPFAKTISELQNDLVVRLNAQPERRPAFRSHVSTSNPLK